MAQLMTATFKWLGLAIAATVLTGCRAEDAAQVNDSPEARHQAMETGAATQGGDSPEAVHQALCAAIQAKDWRKLADCLTPEARDSVAGNLLLDTPFLAMNERDRRAMRDLFERHGIRELDKLWEGPEDPQVTAPLSTDVKLSYQRPNSMLGTNPDAAQAEPPLFATLMVDGKPAAQATRVGFLRVDAVRDDQGKQLMVLKARCCNRNVDGDFVEALGTPFRKNSPPPLFIDLMLERPSAGAKSLALLEGSLQLVTGGQMEQVLIPDIKNIKPETAIENELLKAAGVTLKLSWLKEHAVAGVAKGPVWNIYLLDGKRERLPKSFYLPDYFTLGGFTVGSTKDPLPADVGLRLFVLTGQEPETVLFKFAGVPLPSQDQEAPENRFRRMRLEEGVRKIEEGVRKTAASIIKDKRAFIAETMSLVQTMGALERLDIGVGRGRLADVKIEGDRATAVEASSGDGKERRTPIEFRTIDGRWYVHAPKLRLSK
jgi:hypothetical protein